MPNINITNRSENGLVIRSPVYEKGTAVATAAATWPVGAVLGKVTASGKYARYLSTATDGSQVPIAILAEEITVVVGDNLINPLVGGFVRRGKLVDSAGVALTQAAVDQLRDYTIFAQKTTQLAIQDNQ